MDWRNGLTERELKEIELDKIYAAAFAHGTDGHNARILIAKLVKLLDEAQDRIAELELAQKPQNG